MSGEVTPLAEELTATERVKLEYIRKLIQLISAEKGGPPELLDRIERLLGELDLVDSQPAGPTAKEGL